MVDEDENNIGYVSTGFVGGGSPSAGITFATTITWAETIFDLEGQGFSGGASWSGGADVVNGKAQDGSAVFGAQVVVVGISTPIPEVHGEITQTKVTSLNWLPSWIKKPIIDMANEIFAIYR